MGRYSLRTPLADADVERLRSGDIVLLSGIIYTARDAAHKRLFSVLDENGELPFPLQGSVIYYVGPTPAPPGKVIGSAGPTTSYRMDSYAPRLYDLGIKATIGKGPRSPEVLASLKKNKAVYFGATGGAGALLSGRIVEASLVAFPELGPEAVYRLEVSDFPLLVINDCVGGELYAQPNWSNLK